MEASEFGTPAPSVGSSSISSRRVNSSRAMSANEFEPIEGASDAPSSKLTVNVRTVTADFTIHISKNAKISQLKEEVRFMVQFAHLYFSNL
jgi:hypothetical protein